MSHLQRPSHLLDHLQIRWFMQKLLLLRCFPICKMRIIAVSQDCFEDERKKCTQGAQSILDIPHEFLLCPPPSLFCIQKGEGVAAWAQREKFLSFLIIKLDSYMISNFEAYLDSDRGMFCFVFFMRPKCYQDWATDVLYNLFTFIPVK